MIEEECNVVGHNVRIVKKQEQMQKWLHHGGVHKVNDGNIIENNGVSSASSELLTRDAIADNLGMSNGSYMKIMDVLRGLVKTQDDIEACTNKLKDMMVRCLKEEEDEEEDDVKVETKLTMLNGEYIQDGYTTIEEERIEVGVEDSLSGGEDEKSLFSAEQGACSLSCEVDSARYMNSRAAVLRVWIIDMGPLAGMICKGCYFEDDDSYWWQLDSNSDATTTTSKGACLFINFLLKLMLGMNGMKYLARIMQNFIFDPGGKQSSAH